MCVHGFSIAIKRLLDQNEENIKTKCKEHCKELSIFCKPCNTYCTCVFKVQTNVILTIRLKN